MPRALFLAALLLGAAGCARPEPSEETRAATSRAQLKQEGPRVEPDRLMPRSPERRERVDANAGRIACKEPTPSIPC